MSVWKKCKTLSAMDLKRIQQRCKKQKGVGSFPTREQLQQQEQEEITNRNILQGEPVEFEVVREVLLPSGELVNGLKALQLTWKSLDDIPHVNEVSEFRFYGSILKEPYRWKRQLRACYVLFHFEIKTGIILYLCLQR